MRLTQQKMVFAASLKKFSKNKPKPNQNNQNQKKKLYGHL